LRILLLDGPECIAEDLQVKVDAILSDFLPGSKSDVKVIRKGRKMIEQFRDEKDAITTVGPGWYKNYTSFRLSRNEVVNVFKGPVAIVP